MAIPIIYNIRSVKQRWTSALVAILGITGTVSVFIAMLALARGFELTLVSSGSPDNAIVLRAGSNSEMVSMIELEQAKIIADAPYVAKVNSTSLISPEMVVITAIPLVQTNTDANVQVRGVSAHVLNVRKQIKITKGRMLKPGLTELVVGSHAADTYRGLKLNQKIKIGGDSWTVVGIFDAGGSTFDSEIWADQSILAQVYQRPTNIFQSVTVKLNSPEAYASFKDALSSDPRLNVTVEREIDYYQKQSSMLATMIKVLGTLIALVMGVGAIFGALNTMYSAITERAREIATLRALGFHGGSIVISFVFESMFIALIGGITGCLVVLPLNGLTTGTVNWQSFSHVSFAFSITPAQLITGVVFALLMGLIGGFGPAMHAARGQIATTLRQL
ncbi:MAG: ABC transporter permease [Deltaproteobacteria bacterium]|nr:ABC transporter permease [Deltaproteobacteria bacterium]